MFDDDRLNEIFADLDQISVLAHKKQLPALIAVNRAIVEELLEFSKSLKVASEA